MKYNPSEVEETILTKWEKDNTFTKSIRKNQKPFVIYEGPPTANGKPGIHHVLTRTFKDIVSRYKTMQGFCVERKAGWDEHGLPVEIEIQKNLSLNSKQEIENYGVSKFNKKCAESTQKYIKEWEILTKRMGYWLDFDNAYRTSDPNYISKVWDTLNDLWTKGLIRKDYKVVPWAWDSGTVVSNAEMELGYKKVKDLSAWVKFKSCCDDATAPGGTYFLAWTTTPWTLPANMALAVNPEFEYNVYRIDDKEYVSLSLEGMKYPPEGFQPEGRKIKGSALVGQEYYHPFSDTIGIVLAADFVKAEKTGIVHIAPQFGQDDYNLWQSIPGKITCHLNSDGKFNETAPSYLIGETFSPINTNGKIIKDLSNRGLIWATEYYEHEYPHNWRTDQPLFYYLRPSWYFKTTKIKKEMQEANEKINWFPEHVKHGRFGAWLDNNVDWAISRERFWGTPLPFRENEGFATPKAPHKPEADVDSRTPEVLDCWFDSGAMPFAAFDQYQQADLICEGIDQTRGWFYSLLAIGVGVKGESPYKNVLCLGHVLDKNGHKMAKSKGNTVDPFKTFEKYGADAVRWYMAKNTIGNPINYNEESVRSVIQVFFNRLWNSWVFYDTYYQIDKPKLKVGATNKTDRWILSRITQTTNEVTEAYENYNFSVACQAIEKFVDDLSNVWIRINRSRFWNTDGNNVDASAFWVLNGCLKHVCRLAAPIIPFLTDFLWTKLSEDSVHLQDWPKSRFMDESALKDMEKATTIINEGLKLRDEAKIKLRQTLNSVTVPCKTDLEDIILTELNVKKIIYGDKVELDLVITEELRADGLVREFLRAMQVLRKEQGLVVTDRIKVSIDLGDLKKYIVPSLDSIKSKLLVTEWTEAPADRKIKVEDFVFSVSIEKE